MGWRNESQGRRFLGLSEVVLPQELWKKGVSKISIAGKFLRIANFSKHILFGLLN